MAPAQLRVLHLTRDFPPRNSGGLSSAVGEMVRAQVRAGTWCAVLSFDDYRPKAKEGSGARAPTRERAEDGTEIIRLESVLALPRAKELAASIATDLVHVHHEMLWETGAELAQTLSANAVLTVHTLQSEQNRLREVGSTLSSESQLRALRESAAIHAPSQAVAALIEQRDLELGEIEPGERVRVVRPGIAAWPGSAHAYAQDRFAGPPLLVYVGRFADINGFAQLLEALPTIFAEHRDLRAVVAGGLPGNRRAEERWIKRWQRDAGADADRLQFVGWLAPEALSELYARATILVVPSWFETFGQVLLEGMLHGAPLVTTGAGALAELVDSASAILIATRSAEAIVDGVTRVLADPLAADQRRAAALERARAEGSWDERIGEMLQLYRSLL